MVGYNLVSHHFHRKAWNEPWDYPQSGSLIGLEKTVPALAPFYFSFETNYTSWAVNTFIRTHYWIAPLVTVLYLLFVWLGPKVMEQRRPFDLKTPLKYWNLFVALFSLWGSIRIVPHLLIFIYKVGFVTSLCVPPIWAYSSGAAGFWLMVFTLSKYIELIDTVFIILRKKNLTFLHWSHHATAVLMVWDLFVGDHPPALHLCAMNYTVHAIMYYYYYLAARSKPNWGMLVTMLQITQMIVGVLIGFITFYLSMRYQFIPYTTLDNAFRPFDLNGCYALKSYSLKGLVIYFVFCYLFMSFFWKRYVSYKPPATQKKRE